MSTKTIVLDKAVYADYVSYSTNSLNGTVQLDKIWLEPITELGKNWHLVLNGANLVVCIKKNINGILIASHSYKVESKVDPNQKQPVIDLNHVISLQNETIDNEPISYIVEVSLHARIGIEVYRLYLQMSYDKAYVEVIDSYEIDNPLIIDGKNCRVIKAKVKQFTVDLEYHDIIWLCKALEKKQLVEEDLPTLVLEELKETPYYIRMFA